MNPLSDRQKALAEKVAKKLSESGHYTFSVGWLPVPSFHWACIRKEPSYPCKTPEGKELGLMFIQGELRHIYFDSERRVKWPDDWIDPYPPSIDRVDFMEDSIEISNFSDANLDFMSHAYYYTLYRSWEESRREDLMKIAMFLPAVIKDLVVFLRLMNDTLDKWGIDRSEFRITWFGNLSYRLKFSVKDMNDKIVDDVLDRAKALAELRGKFREWLSDERRKEYYENTMLYPEDPFREGRLPDFLYKWPPGSVDKETYEWYLKQVKSELWEGIIRCYNLDGCRLRLARKTRTGFRYLGRVDKKGWIKIDKSKIREEDLGREDIIVAVDERLERLPKFPLEKIEFLKEDFPEMFK